MLIIQQRRGKMKIAIIGAGCSGLSAARYSIAEGHQIDVFEQNSEIGGTWIYNKNTGVDENGIPIHSSMYEGLITNIPKELMEYEGFRYPSDLMESYIPQARVLKYMQDFVKHFNLEPFIKFNYQVTEVDLVPNEKWKITTRNLKTKQEFVEIYDVVLICNGHFKEIRQFQPKGMESFKGNQSHSHYFRTKEHYVNKKVLVIGAGPSGADIASILSEVTQKTFITYKRSTWPISSDKVIIKPWIEEVFENSVKFEDGTVEEITDIIFCTGYVYDFPFLTPKCGITVEDNFVKPLYKHMINIEHPTMAILGLMTHIRYFPVLDLQSKFMMGFLKKSFNITKEEMWDDFNNQLSTFKASGKPLRRIHVLIDNENEYCEELSRIANIPNLPEYNNNIFNYIKKNYNRNDKFRVINDKDFELIK